MRRDRGKKFRVSVRLIRVKHARVSMDRVRGSRGV